MIQPENPQDGAVASLRSISKDDFAKMCENHTTWLKGNGVNGECADFRGINVTEHLQTIKKHKSALEEKHGWNWKKEPYLQRSIFSAENFSNDRDGEELRTLVLTSLGGIIDTMPGHHTDATTLSEKPTSQSKVEIEYIKPKKTAPQTPPDGMPRKAFITGGIAAIAAILTPNLNKGSPDEVEGKFYRLNIRHGEKCYDLYAELKYKIMRGEKGTILSGSEDLEGSEAHQFKNLVDSYNNLFLSMNPGVPEGLQDKRDILVKHLKEGATTDAVLGAFLVYAACQANNDAGQLLTIIIQTVQERVKSFQFWTGQSDKTVSLTELLRDGAGTSGYRIIPADPKITLEIAKALKQEKLLQAQNDKEPKSFQASVQPTIQTARQRL